MTYEEDLKKYLEWLDEQIILTVRHNHDTVVSWIVHTRARHWGYNNELEDAICHELVEAFLDENFDTVIKELKIHWEIMPTNKTLTDLLLCVPIQYLSCMIKYSKTYEKRKPKK